MLLENHRLSKSHSRRKAIMHTLAWVALACSLPAFGQVQQQSLTAALKGVDAVTTIQIGISGCTEGSNQDLPVNTLVYPNGEIAYKIEAGFIHMDVVRMRNRYSAGTSFQIDGLDYKNDRLEFNLVSRDGRSMRLKVMLGANWQTKMSNPDVLAVVSKFLVIPSSVAPPVQAVIAAGSQNQAPPQYPPAPTRYSRRANAPSIPGRIPDSDLQSVFDGFAKDREMTFMGLAQDASTLAQGLLGFQAAYSSDRTRRMMSLVEEIVQLQGRLGKKLQPRSLSDIAEMSSLYGRCAELAQFRQAIDVQPTGRAMNSLGLQQLASRSGTEFLAKAERDLEDAKVKIASSDSAESEIVGIESSLDMAAFTDASKKYQKLASDTQVKQLATVQDYLQRTIGLRQDLMAYVEASQLDRRPGISLVDQVTTITTEANLLSRATGKPLASELLTTHLGSDKVALNARIDALPTFQFNPKDYDFPSAPTSPTTAAVLRERLNKLRAKIETAADLSGLLANPTAMNGLSTSLGSSAVDVVKRKGAALLAAQTLEANMSVRLMKEDQQLAAEKAQRDSETAEINSLSQQIVNGAVEIGILQYRFFGTRILGYKMEADKRRSALSDLVYRDRKFMNATVWRSVDEGYQRLLPGLTVEQDEYAQAVITELKRAAKQN